MIGRNIKPSIHSLVTGTVASHKDTVNVALCLVLASNVSVMRNKTESKVVAIFSGSVKYNVAIVNRLMCFLTF